MEINANTQKLKELIGYRFLILNNSNFRCSKDV